MATSVPAQDHQPHAEDWHAAASARPPTSRSWTSSKAPVSLRRHPQQQARRQVAQLEAGADRGQRRAVRAALPGAIFGAVRAVSPIALSLIRVKDRRPVGR